MQKITRKNLRPFLEKHATKDIILDIGGGHAENNHSYGDIFPNRHTLDIDPLRKPDTVGDVHQLPFGDGSFDHILCTEVLEHLHTPQRAIDEMHRVLRENGRLILTTRFVFPIHDAPNDFYRYTKYGLRHLLRAWDIEELVPETNTIVTIAALLQRISFQTTMRGGKFTKGVLYLITWCIGHLPTLIKKEFGDIRRKTNETDILTTGYYVVATKRASSEVAQ
ncbi:MAG: class I SAM-dependent methyltransferase [Patescibacteria group bacterium]